MLNDIRDLSNIILGKVLLDPQKIEDYFNKK
jgi:hypothetical protein